MKRKKIILYVLMGVLVVLTVVALYIYKEYNRTHTDTALIKPDFSLPAVDLIKEFEKNETSAGKKYWDKVISVGGMIKEIEQDDAGNYSVSLGDTALMSSVRCSIDSSHKQEVNAIRQWDNIVVKGICAGFNANDLLGSDVLLVRCVLDK